VFVLNGSRGRVAAALALDAVIDDRLENCLDVLADSTARPILVRRAGPQAAPGAASNMGIESVGSFAEAVAYLEGAAIKGSKPGFVGRLRQTLGI
jgi:hypothetical protein